MRPAFHRGRKVCERSPALPHRPRLAGSDEQRIYADGKTETSEWKAGDVKALGPDRQYKPKNIGKTDFLIYVVEIK